MQADKSRQDLIELLQLAYSAERAAAYAYREEWHHRELVGEMLSSLGAQSSRQREVRSLIVGRVLGVLCHVMGWLAPMYGAGRLESRNIGEYETAARYARDSGREDFTDCLLMMAEVEWEHESYFRSRVLLHPLGRQLSLWPAPPPKEMIRTSFGQEREEPFALVEAAS